MLKKLLKWEILGIIVVIAVGTLLHFVYEWTNENIFIAALSPVNESTWEHLKMLFTPMFLFTLIEFIFIGHNYQNFLIAKALGILLGLYAILSFVYTYSGIIGKNILFIDISIFVIAVCLAHVISYFLIKYRYLYTILLKWLGIIIIILLLISFVTFTYYPPNIKLFLDPVTKSYGI